MKILSIDVGIKNLAFCLFNLNKTSSQSSSQYEISCWDVIDICETKEKNSCNIDLCKSDAKFFKSNIFLCRKHAKKGEYLIPSKKYNINSIKKNKMNDIKNFCIENNICVDSCKLKNDYIDSINNFISEKCYDVIEEKNANNMTLVDLGINLQTRFDNIFKDHKIDIILIENQISPIANRMKTLQGMIAQYFIMRDVRNIEFVSASNKLKKHLNKKKSTYSERKKLSIELVVKQFNNNHEIKRWKQLFDNHKKKDDLADSFLQGIWYLEEKKYIDDFCNFIIK